MTRESLRVAWEMGDNVWIPKCLEELAGALVHEGRALEAARLLGAAAALADLSPPPVRVALQEPCQSVPEAVRARSRVPA